MFSLHGDYANIMRYKHVKICYNMINIFEHERKNEYMVQLIQNFFSALRFSPVNYGYNFDNVDANLVRYFRNEYGRDWQGALGEHLHKTNKNRR